MNSKKKGMRLGAAAWIIAAGLGMSVVGGIGQVASAESIDPGFCIVASSDDGKFIGQHGGKCEGASQPVEPEQPAEPEWPTMPAFACSVTHGWPEHTIAASWDPVPGAAGYKITATSPDADWKIIGTTTDASGSVKIPQFAIVRAVITVEAVDAGGARLRISQGFANISPIGNDYDSICSEIMDPIE